MLWEALITTPGIVAMASLIGSIVAVGIAWRNRKHATDLANRNHEYIESLEHKRLCPKFLVRFTGESAGEGQIIQLINTGGGTAEVVKIEQFNGKGELVEVLERNSRVLPQYYTKYTINYEGLFEVGETVEVCLHFRAVDLENEMMTQTTFMTIGARCGIKART